MSSIFFPLRTNAAWFESADTQNRLVRQLKISAALYDRIVVQDGRYRVFAGADIQGMSVMLPAHAIGSPRDEIVYYEKGNEFGVALGGKQVLRSECDQGFDVDFWLFRIPRT